MNSRINNNTLISEIFQVTSPEDFDAMDIEFILNKIENTNDAHIYMLKGYISPKLFSKILLTVSSMVRGVLTYTGNLERLKKLLPIEKYLEWVKCCLDVIVKKNLINLNIPNIRDNIPQELYKIFVDKYLKNENCWKYFFKSTQDSREEYILTLLSSESPTLEEHLLLINVPNSVVKYLDYKKYNILSQIWTIKGEPNSGYCRECIHPKDRIFKRTEVISLSSKELFHDYLSDPKYWCCECLYRPLLEILGDFTSYETTEFVGDYRNSINIW